MCWLKIKNFLDQKSTYAGSTVHFLSHDFDFGPVLERCFVKIEKGDTVESLYSRLKKEEHKIMIKSLKQVINNKKKLDRIDIHIITDTIIEQDNLENSIYIKSIDKIYKM